MPGAVRSWSLPASPAGISLGSRVRAEPHTAQQGLLEGMLSDWCATQQRLVSVQEREKGVGELEQEQLE